MEKTTYISHAVLIVAVVFICSHLPGSSFASRPFVTEDAGVAGKGIVQFELSWDYLKWRNNDREHVFTFVPIIGIADEVELSLEAPFMSHQHSGAHVLSGIGDVNLVTKFLLKEESDLFPAFALKTVVKTTTGSIERGFGSGALDYGLVAVASKQLGDLTLHTMFGYTFIGKNGDESLRDIFVHGVAAEYAMTENVHLVAEFAGNRHPDRMVDEHPNGAMLGATFILSDQIIVDASTRLGTNSVTPDWNTSVGLTVSL